MTLFTGPPSRRVKKADQAYQDRVRALGCLICERPASLHHTRFGVGMGQKSKERSILPLCPDHHQWGGHGVAFHAGKKTWQQIYGTEEALLKVVEDKLDEAEAVDRG
jgi:hypothetical protein